MKAENTDTTKKDTSKMTFKEFFAMSRWIFQVAFKIDAWYMTLYCVVSVIYRAKGFINALIIAKSLDTVIKIIQTPETRIELIYPYLALILGYNILSTLISYIRSHAVWHLYNFGRPKIRKFFYTKLNEIGIQTLEKPDINNRISRAENYLGAIIPQMDGLIRLVADCINALIAFSIILKFMPLIIPAVVVITIPYLLFDRKYRKKLYDFTFGNTEQTRRAGTISSDLMNSKDIEEININGAFAFLDQKYQDFYKWYIPSMRNISQAKRIGNHFFIIGSDVLVFIGYVVVFKNFIGKTISLGDITFQMKALDTLQNSVISVVESFNELFEYSIQMRDIYILFNTKPEVPNGSVKLARLDSGPEIEFEDVTFKYPNAAKFVLENFNLSIKSGEKIAIVGHNGAGKTTLVKLLCRFYETTKGSIVVNGSKINDLEISSYYQNMGVLFQDYNTYPQLTVKENILIGRTDEPLDEVGVRLAAISADAIDFIEELPNKFETVLSEKYKGGVRLSTGQWQKIAIARFFYRNAPFVIFDEPTAAIDAVSEYNIFNKIYQFFTGKTVIIISHRFSTVRNADRIIVIDHGQIVEEGTHHDLMELNGTYAKAFLLQAEGYSK